MSKRQDKKPPGWTMIPNEVLDNLASFSDAELRITLAAMREMLGWHKTAPQEMSYSWFRDRTGLSDTGVKSGVKAAKERGWLVEGKERGARKVRKFIVPFDEEPSTSDTISDSDIVSEKHSEPSDLVSGKHSDIVSEKHSEPSDLGTKSIPLKKELKKDTKESSSTEGEPPLQVLPQPLHSEDLAKTIQSYERWIGAITVGLRDILLEWLNDYSADWICDAFEESAKNNVRKLKYAKAILERWQKEGRGKTQDDVKARADTAAKRRDEQTIQMYHELKRKEAEAIKLAEARRKAELEADNEPNKRAG